MRNPRRVGAGTGAQWRAMVSSYTKAMGVPAGTIAASQAWRSGEVRNTGVGAADNPWVKGYSFYRPASRSKTVKVKSYWKPKGGTPEGKRPKTGGISKKSMLRAHMAALGRKSGRARKALRGTAVANPRVGGYSYYKPSIGKTVRVKGFVRRNPPFTYAVPGVPNPKRKKSRRNPEFAYKVASLNPVEAMGLFENPGAGVAETAKAFVASLTAKEFLVDNLLPIGAGFLVTRVLTAKAIPMLAGKELTAEEAAKPENKTKVEERAKKLDDWKKRKPFVEAGIGILGGLGLGLGLKNTKLAVRFTSGALISGLVSYIETTEFWKGTPGKPGYGTITGLGEVGQITDEVRRRLAAEVKQAVKAAEAGTTVAAFATEQEAEGVSAFATEEESQGAIATEEENQGVEGMSDGAAGVTIDEFFASPSQI